jgi:hypothetical protein
MERVRFFDGPWDGADFLIAEARDRFDCDVAAMAGDGQTWIYASPGLCRTTRRLTTTPYVAFHERETNNGSGGADSGLKTTRVVWYRWAPKPQRLTTTEA